jgi:hypothetical protein
MHTLAIQLPTAALFSRFCAYLLILVATVVLEAPTPLKNITFGFSARAIKYSTGFDCYLLHENQPIDASNTSQLGDMRAAWRVAYRRCIKHLTLADKHAPIVISRQPGMWQSDG